jgi:hypothetical protein
MIASRGPARLATLPVFKAQTTKWRTGTGSHASRAYSYCYTWELTDQIGMVAKSALNTSAKSEHRQHDYKCVTPALLCLDCCVVVFLHGAYCWLTTCLSGLGSHVLSCYKVLCNIECGLPMVYDLVFETSLQPVTCWSITSSPPQAAITCQGQCLRCSG